jgi:hypothetical protein
MKALVERRNELLIELSKLSEDLAKDPTLLTKFQELALEIASLGKDIQEKKHKDQEESTTAPATA